MKYLKIAFSLLFFISLFTSCTDEVVDEKREFSQNETAETKYFQIQILNVHTSYGNSTAFLDDGYLYVVVDISVKNISQEKQSVSTYDWKMQNSNGIETGSEMGSAFANNSLSIDLLPGGTITGVLFFEEPIQNSGLKLAYYGNAFVKDPILTFAISANCSGPVIHPEPYAKSEKVTYADIEYSVAESKTSKGSGYTLPSAGNIFLGVKITAKNVSAYDAIDVDSYDWKIIDSDGTSYDTTWSDPWKSDHFSGTKLEVGGTVTWFMVFEVKANKKWQLAYVGSIFSSGKKFSFQLN